MTQNIIYLNIFNLNMQEKIVISLFVLVAIVAIGGLVLTNTTNSTVAFVSADHASNCKMLNSQYNNCITPNGGCKPAYPEYKQYTYNIKGIFTCCCVPHYSNTKGKPYGGSLYQ